MIIATSVFGDLFGRLLEAHRRSIAANCPNAEHRIYWADGAVEQNAKLPLHCTTNTVKLQQWAYAVETIDDDVVLIDADTIVLGDLSQAFGNFDVGITVRPGPYPLNGGVVFVRNTPQATAFIQRWRRLNDRLYSDTQLAQYGVDVYGGINQASLAHAMLASPEVRIEKLPCEIWNSVDQTWDTFSPETRVLHIKGKLRRMALEAIRLEEDVPIQRCLEAWDLYDPEAVDSASVGG